MVGLLIAHGADPDATDSEGRPPLALAVSRGHAGVVELLSGHLFLLQANQTTVVRLSYNASRPLIDGLLDEPFWKQGPPLVSALDVLSTGQSERGGLRSEAWLGADRQWLYIGARCGIAEGAALRRPKGDFDAPGLGDDSLEVFLVSPAGGSTDFQLLVGANGAPFSMTASAAVALNPRIATAVSRGKASFDIEIRIPWSEIGEPDSAESSLGVAVLRR